MVSGHRELVIQNIIELIIYYKLTGGQRMRLPRGGGVAGKFKLKAHRPTNKHVKSVELRGWEKDCTPALHPTLPPPPQPPVVR